MSSSGPEGALLPLSRADSVVSVRPLSRQGSSAWAAGPLRRQGSVARARTSKPMLLVLAGVVVAALVALGASASRAGGARLPPAPRAAAAVHVSVTARATVDTWAAGGAAPPAAGAQQQQGPPAGGAAAAGAAPPADAVSALTLHVPAGATAEELPPRRVVYRFDNVQVRGDAIVFRGGRGARAPAPLEVEVDGAPAPAGALPTSLLLRDGRRLAVEHAAEPLGAAECAGWLAEPALLLAARRPGSAWRAWTDAIAGAFQTLRELGLLPLVEVTASGVVSDNRGGCPAALAPGAAAPAPLPGCALPGAAPPARPPARCTPGGRGQAWCRRGLRPLPAANASRAALVYAAPEAADGPWAALLSAMVRRQRQWADLDGWCLRSLVVGTTDTLDVALPPAGGAPGAARRAAAADVLSRFAYFALARLSAGDVVSRDDFLDAGGYRGWAAERLRQGLPPKDTEALNKVYAPRPGLGGLVAPRPTPAAQAALAADVAGWEASGDAAWLFGKAPRTAVRPGGAPAAAAALPPRGGAPPPAPAPAAGARRVVTVLSSLPGYTRAALNERQLLRLIARRYDAQLRVTTLEEPTLEAAELLRRTDVLVGMHGDGWAHAVFLKRGAAALQLFPYGWGARAARGGGGGASEPPLLGPEVRELVSARGGAYAEWANPFPQYAFFRREDFLDANGTAGADGALPAWRAHPDAGTPAPRGPAPAAWHPAWRNQNTYLDLVHLRPALDAAMRAAGVGLQPGQRWV